MEAYSSRKFMTYIWPYIKKLLEKDIYLISQEKLSCPISLFLYTSCFVKILSICQELPELYMIFIAFRNK